MAIKKKVIVIPAVALVLAGGGLYACSSLSKMSQNLPGMEYTVVKASKNDLSQMISTTGKVIGNGKVDVTTKLTCTVAEVKVSLGDHVKEGDVLCVFDSTDLEEEYESLKKQLSNSDLKEEDGHNKNERDLQAAQTKKQTAIERAQRAIDSAKRDRDNAYNAYNKSVQEYNAHANAGDELDYASMSAALDKEYAALSAYDDAVDKAIEAYNDAVTQGDEAIQNAKDQIKAEEYSDDDEIQKKLDKLKEQIDQCVVKAPQSGTITALNVNEGTIPTSAALMTIVNTDKTVIEFTLKETDFVKVQEGMSAVVTSKVTPDDKNDAKITRLVNVLSVPTTEGEAAGYKAEVTLDKTNDKLLIGMSATVDITVDSVGEKLSVPYSGIVEEDGKNYVYVAVPMDDEQGGYEVKKKSIIPGIESDFYTEVAGGDVMEGDRIIEDPIGGDLPDVREGERIQIHE